MTAVVALEHTRLRPGEIAASLAAWRDAVLPGTLDRLAPACMCPECSGDAPRRRLDRALAALPRWARPHLYALVLPLDRRFRALTAPDPHAPPDWPWWRRRVPVRRA